MKPKPLAYVLLVLVGVMVGVTGSFVQQHVWSAAGIAWPDGAVLALIGVAAACFGGAALTGDAFGAAIPGGVWLATVLVINYVPRNGAVVIEAATTGYLFLFGGTVIATAATYWAATVVLRRRIREARAVTDRGANVSEPAGRSKE